MRLLWIAPLLLAACSPDLAINADVIIVCNDGRCPAGFTCNPTSKRCVEQGRDDVTAPQLTLASITPAIARLGAPVSIIVTVDEPVQDTPELSFSREGLSVFLTATAVEAQRFEYRYTPDQDDVDGERPLSFRVSDRIGNVAEGRLGGSLVFDFTSPTVLADSASLRLEPALATNPLRVVDAAAPGTAVKLSFITTELLEGDPVVTSEPAGVAFTKNAGAGVTFEYGVDWVASATVADGLYAIRVALVDAAGNTSEEVLPNLEVSVDRTPPLPPTVDALDAVTLYRAPWGTAGTNGAVVTSIEGTAGAVEPMATVLVLSGPEVLDARGGLGDVLVRGVADTQGAFGGPPGAQSTLTMPGTDRERVWVAAVDSAGNISDADGDRSNGVQASPVRDVVWVASLLGKIAGSRSENPHDLLARPSAASGLQQGDSPPIGQSLAELTSMPVQTRGAGSWKFFGPQRTFTSARNFAGAWDAARQQLVMFGDVADLWEYDGFSWTRRYPVDPEGDGDPGARYDYALGYDAATAMVLLYGGCGSQISGACAEFLGDFWGWDGTSWRQLCGSAECQATAPPALMGSRLVYDEVRRKILLFGGLTRAVNQTCERDLELTAGGCASNELYEWSGQRWHRLCDDATCTSTAPRHRFGAAAAYDPVREVLYVYGGCGLFAGIDSLFCVQQLEDLWIWDGAAWRTPPVADPERDGNPGTLSRQHGIMAFDTARGAIVLVDSANSGTKTWTWTGESWRLLSPLDDRPDARCNAAGAFDEVRREFVMFGGCRTGCGRGRSACVGPTDETWLWTPDRWVRAQTRRSPQPRGEHSMTFDRARGAVIVAGGDPSDGFLWMGNGWTPSTTLDCSTQPCSVSPSVPAERKGPAVVWDGGGTLYAGGRDFDLGGGGRNEPFGYRLQATGWAETCAAGACPDEPLQAAYAGVAFDEARLEVVMFGGVGEQTRATRIWDGGTWTTTVAVDDPSQPPWRHSMGMVYDRARAKVMLHGGSVYPAFPLGGARVSVHAELAELRRSVGVGRRRVDPPPGRRPRRGWRSATAGSAHGRVRGDVERDRCVRRFGRFRAAAR